MSAVDDTAVTEYPRPNDDTEVFTQVINPERRKERRILHFSDGTLEESDSGSEEPIVPVTKSTAAALSQSSPDSIADKERSWASWMWDQSSKGGTKTLNFLDYLGESFAYYLGITSSKYQYEIDEYHRMKQEEEDRTNKDNIELASWSSPSSSKSGLSQVQTVTSTTNPIVTEVLSSNSDA